MKQSARGIAARAGAIAVLGAALASAAPVKAADKITIGALRFTSHAPSFIAYERGYFKKEGLDVELKFFQAAQPIAVAIASGDIDIGVTALTGGFFNLASKGAVKVIGGLYYEKKGYPGMAIMASNKAHADGLTSPDKLKGRTFAMTQMGSSFHYMAGMIAKANGFTLQDIKVRPLQQVGAMIGAVKSGQLDAMTMVPHVAAPLEKSGAAKIVGWVRDLGPYQVTTIFTSTRNTQEKKELLKRFMRAYAKAIDDYRAVMLDQDKDPKATEAMIRLIHKYVYASRPYDKAAPGIKAGAVYMNKDARLDLGSVKEQLDWFQAQNLAPKSLTYKAIVADGFAETFNAPK